MRALDADLATFFSVFGFLLIPAFILLFIGFGLAMIAAALLVAAFGARQVRETGSLMRREPGPVLVAGVIGMIALPLLVIALMATVVGAPIGVAMLFVLLLRSPSSPGSWLRSGSATGSWSGSAGRRNRIAPTAPRWWASWPWRSGGRSPS